MGPAWQRWEGEQGEGARWMRDGPAKMGCGPRGSGVQEGAGWAGWANWAAGKDGKRGRKGGVIWAGLKAKGGERVLQIFAQEI